MHISDDPLMFSKAQVLHFFELEPHFRLLHRPCNYGDRSDKKTLYFGFYFTLMGSIPPSCDMTICLEMCSYAAIPSIIPTVTSLQSPGTNIGNRSGWQSGQDPNGGMKLHLSRNHYLLKVIMHHLHTQERAPFILIYRVTIGLRKGY